MDYLQEAKQRIERAPAIDGVEWAKFDAQLAIACALVAQTELLATQTELLVALIERLDRVIDSEDNTLYVTLTK